ncbi:MAG: CBS domain-containing protein [Gemmatimonadales bacterium]|jgi:Mg/Co/Ni transporter MgtE
MRAFDVCARGFAEFHPEDAARVIEIHPVSEAAAFLDDLPVAAASRVVERMSPAAGADCLNSVSAERGAAIVESLVPTIAAAFLRRMTPDRQEALSCLLAEDLKNRLRQLMMFPPESIGSIADPGVLSLPQDVTIGEALRQLRRHKGAVHHHVYVIDRTQRLSGVVHIRDLVTGQPKTPLSTVMDPLRARLFAASSVANAVGHAAWREVDTLPVVDESGILLGMVRYRQVRQLEPTLAAHSVVDTLLSLGELYWMGLSAFLPRTTTGAEVRESSGETQQGNQHHG